MSYIFDVALFFQRLPDSQEAVKPRDLGLRGRPAHGLGNALEAEEIRERRAHGEDRDVTVRAGLPIANRQVLGHALRLFEPSHRVPLAADLVDKLERNGLAAAEDLAGRGG